MPRVSELPRFSVPGHCIMFPGRRRDDRGFFLFDTVIDGPNGDVRIGISAEGLRTIADRNGAQLGIARLEDLEMAHEHLADTEHLLEQAQARIAELEEFKDRISGMVADGFEIKRRMGRPPTKKED